MKKLIVLMLVLGMTSSASALLVTLDPSGAAVLPAGSYNVDVVSDSDVVYSYLLAVPDKTYGSITSVTKTAKAGEDGSVIPFGDAMGYFSVYSIEALDMTEPFDSVLAGIQFQTVVNFTGAAVGENLTLLLMKYENDQFINLDSRTFEGVPEPMTIALLGLGGLFLRRRK